MEGQEVHDVVESGVEESLGVGGAGQVQAGNALLLPVRPEEQVLVQRQRVGLAARHQHPRHPCNTSSQPVYNKNIILNKDP